MRKVHIYYRQCHPSRSGSDAPKASVAGINTVDVVQSLPPEIQAAGLLRPKTLPQKRRPITLTPAAYSRDLLALLCGLMIIRLGRHGKPRLDILDDLLLQRLFALDLVLGRLAPGHRRVTVVARAAPPGSAPRGPRQAGVHRRLCLARGLLLLFGIRQRRVIIKVASPTTAGAGVG